MYSSTDGGLIDLDGANDRATTSGSTVLMNASQDFSFDAWIKIDDTSINSIFNIGDYYQSSGFTFYTASGTTNLSVYTNNALAFSSSAAGTNTWKHVALSRSGSTVTVYIDGTSVGTFTHSAALSGQFDLANANITEPTTIHLTVKSLTLDFTLVKHLLLRKLIKTTMPSAVDSNYGSNLSYYPVFRY